MSIELALSENTMAVRNLTDAIARASLLAPIPELEKMTAEEVKTPPPAKRAPAKKPAPTPAKAPPEVTIAEVSAMVVAFAQKKGRAPTVALLKQYGAARATEIDPESFEDFMTVAKNALDEPEADAADDADLL